MYTENYKTFKEIKEDTMNVKTLYDYGPENLILLKWQYLPN